MVEHARDESCGPNDVLIEIAACGVCHTDLSFYYDAVPTRQPFPLTLGHEISGHVVATGADAQSWLSRDVIVPSILPCGVCPACRAGHARICPAQLFPGSSVHGGFGTHIRVPAAGLCPVPDLADRARNPTALDLVALAVVADAVSTPYQAIVRSGLSAGDVAVFVGTGGLGGFGVQLAAALGAHVVGIDVDQERLTNLNGYGLSLALDASALDVTAMRRAVRAFADEHGVPTWRTKIFETSGQPMGQTMAFGLLGRGSVLSVVGYTAQPIELRLSNLMAYDATAQGTWGCLPELYPAIVDLALAGRIAIEPFIERRPLSAINGVFEDLRAGRMKRRVVLIPGNALPF
jgi:6-hydroxycyclohex-1-ene-1-carbonyl-CoA dehydrogenase